MRSFLVLSDIHFGSFADHPDFLTSYNKSQSALSKSRAMVDELINVAQSTKLKFDGILVPGDLTSEAQPIEFIECMELLRKIASALNINESSIFITYGNHDVNWGISKLSISKEGGFTDESYKKLAAHVGPNLLDLRTPDIEGPLPGCGVYKENGFELISLNSGYQCCHDQKIKNGNLGTAQMQWIKTIPAPSNEAWRILMVHHHPMNLPYPTAMTDISTLAEGADLLAEINRLNIDFVVHGHRHHAMLNTDLKQGWTKPVTFLCSGSVGVGAKHRNDGDIPNAFHIISFRTRTDKNACSGTVHTYCFRGGSGWFKNEYSKEVPLDPDMFFGACATEPEAQQSLVDILAPYLKRGDRLIKMPGLESLSLELRCLPVFKVNRITEEILNLNGYRMAGSYPKDVAAIKS
jgi:UDP-2,3-diacylglucosamine pyrophosphatase LpxH